MLLLTEKMKYLKNPQIFLPLILASCYSDYKSSKEKNKCMKGRDARNYFQNLHRRKLEPNKFIFVPGTV